jgi:hypothetical protein
MSKAYVVDGHQVVVGWTHRMHDEDVAAVVYTIHRDGAALAGGITKTSLGMFCARGDSGQHLGTFRRLQRATEAVVRAEY